MAADTFQALLSNYRDTTLAGLLSAVPQHEPQRHLYAPLSSSLSRIGKGHQAGTLPCHLPGIRW